MLTYRTQRLKFLAGAMAFSIAVYWLYRARSLREPTAPLLFDSLSFLKEEIGDDPINLKWSHATNSKEKLQKAIQAGVHCIEADVMLKNEGMPNQALVPIMSHPPSHDSDLTLEEFLSMSLDHGKALVKLDFKSMQPVELSLQILSSKRDVLTVPVWLNADILPGPASPRNAAVTVPAERFLNKIKTEFSDFTLSLGWTSSASSGLSYSWSHVDAMYNAINSHLGRGQGLTFPVNAALLKGSVTPLMWLCEQYDASLTLFQSSVDDAVDVSELVYVRSKYPKSRVYYDLQPQTLDNFKKVADDPTQLNAVHKATDKYLYKSEEWVLKVTDNKASEMRVSSDVVWLRGPNAQLSSVRPVSVKKDLTLRGAVTLLPQAGKSQARPNLQIYMYGKDHLESHPTGVRLSLDYTGRMIVTTDHVSEQDKVYEDREVGISADHCYQFEVEAIGYDLTFTVRVLKDNCHTLHDSQLSMESSVFAEQTISLKLTSAGLVSPYSIILRNGNPDGFAILEQIDMQLTAHKLT